MARLRTALLGVVAVAGLLWTALWAPSFVDGVTADCAGAASEVSDPCAWGQFTFVAATVGVWLVGTLVLALLWVALWRRGR